VLDNLEHLLGAAPLLAELLANCEGVSLLATSRVAIRIRAEQRYRVAPLAVPPDGASTPAIAASPAVGMFVDRARAASPEFALNEANASAIGAICRYLDGIPLAIELAAVRVGLLGAETLLGRLERSLSVLGDAASDLPERQQTLRQTLDWSHQLLAPEDRILLRRLAVFSGGWTLDAAEAVCDGGPLQTPDILACLSRLVDNSMVLEYTGTSRGHRFRMLEPIREYAHARLVEAGETQEFLRKHLRWALEIIQPVTPDPPEPDSVNHLSDEADNVRGAMRTAIEVGAIEDGLWLAVAMSTLWFVRGAYAEGRAWLTELLGLPGVEMAPVARAHALTAAGHFATCQGDYAISVPLLADAAVLARDLDQQLLGGVIQHFQGNVCRWTADLDGARARYESALAIYRRVGHPMWSATALVHLAFVLLDQGALDRAAACAEESRAAFEAAGNTWGASRALRVLGRVAARREEGAMAQALHQRSVAMDRELRDEHGSALSMLAMANDVAHRADAPRAWRLYGQSFMLAERAAIAWCVPAAWKGSRCSPSAQHPSEPYATPRLQTACAAASAQAANWWSVHALSPPCRRRSKHSAPPPSRPRGTRAPRHARPNSSPTCCSGTGVELSPARVEQLEHV
jgi:predicted ATPase